MKKPIKSKPFAPIFNIQESINLSLKKEFFEVRKQTEHICSWLKTEDQVVQPAAFVSPPKWHLAHTAWFFDRFILEPIMENELHHPPTYNLLFNSYYKSQGKHWLQGNRGQLSRPTVNEIMKYRICITEGIIDLLDSESVSAEQQDIISMGIQHEKQHQELLLMDIKYILGSHPWAVPYDEPSNSSASLPEVKYLKWIDYPEKISLIGGAQNNGFVYDNETPQHRRLIHHFLIADRLISNGEYLDFIEDGGYKRPELWLSDGWEWVLQHHINQPLYWFYQDDVWNEYHLKGLYPIELNLPVSHISYFEADAYARWAGKRLPTEFELEHFLNEVNPDFGAENAFWKPYHDCYPSPERACDVYGNGLLWQWTQSPYSAYPGYAPAAGAFGEYNGKFMVNQYVLKGGCVASPQNHIRASYRNFYRPSDRWAFTGIRLAKDL